MCCACILQNFKGKVHNSLVVPATTYEFVRVTPSNSCQISNNAGYKYARITVS